MVNHDPCFDKSVDGRDFTSNTVLNSNPSADDKRTLKADSSEKPSTNVSEASSIQHRPCTNQNLGVAPREKSQNTQLKSDSSSSHFLRRDFASSGEQIMFHFFLDITGDSQRADTCLREYLASNSPIPVTPKSFPSPPPPSPESPSESNAPGRSYSGRSVAQEPPSS